MKLTRLGIIGIFSSLILAVGCTKPPKLSKAGSSGDAAPSVTDVEPTEIIFTAESKASFEANLYAPTISAECNKCHHAEEHHTDVEASFAYFTDGSHANFQRSEYSSVVKKVADGHTCWSGDCVVDSETILNGINTWFAEVDALGWERPEITYSGGKSAEVDFAGITDHVLDVDQNQYLGAAFSTATSTNSWATAMADDPDGAIIDYVVAPAGNNPRNEGDAAAGTSAFTVNVLTAGNYFAWFRTKMLDDAQNEFFVNDGTTTFPMDNDTEPTGDAWTWRQLLETDQNDERVPVALTLAAGANTVTISEREGGVKLGYMLLTSRTDPNTEIFNVKFYDLAVDISDIAGTNATLVATIWEKAQGEDQVKAIGVKELRVESDKPLRIKGIYPLIDGFFESTHSTYTAVDGTFGGSEVRADQIIRTGGATGNTWLGDMAVDKISFGFDVLEVAE